MINRLSAYLAVGFVAFGSLGLAQTIESADDWQPSAINQRGQQYPMVNPEGRVRVRVVAPEALNVQFDIGAVKYPLTKGENGAWV